MISNEDLDKFQKYANSNSALEIHLIKSKDSDLYGLLYVSEDLLPCCKDCDNTLYIYCFAADNHLPKSLCCEISPEQFLLLLEGKIKANIELIKRLA